MFRQIFPSLLILLSQILMMYLPRKQSSVISIVLAGAYPMANYDGMQHVVLSGLKLPLV